MRCVFVLGLVLACGGPSHNQLVETPSATNPPRHVEAPPASTSDKDRERMTQSFEDMETTQRAYNETGQGAGSAQLPPQAGPPAKPVKKGPAVQAPPQPK